MEADREGHTPAPWPAHLVWKADAYRCSIAHISNGATQQTPPKTAQDSVLPTTTDNRRFSPQEAGSISNGTGQPSLVEATHFRRGCTGRSSRPEVSRPRADWTARAAGLLLPACSTAFSRRILFMSDFLPSCLSFCLRPWRLSAPSTACRDWQRRFGRYLRSIGPRFSASAPALSILESLGSVFRSDFPT